MKEKQSKKTLIILIVIAIVGLIIYFYITGKPSDSSVSSLETGESATDAQLAGTRVLNLLNQINSLKIDSTIFESPAYKSLIDYSVAIPERSIGRQNPFAPIK